MSDKRQDYISWDEYFMGVAMLSAMRSKDPHTQVGACIVSDDHKILSMGYNGFPMDVRMTIFLGVVRESLTITSIFIRHTVN